MMINFRQILFLFTFLFILTGCTAPDVNTVTRKDFIQDSFSFGDADMTELAVGDTIELSVELDGQMEVSRHRVEINYYGVATLPLVGDVTIARLKLDEARLAITRAYSAYYVNPPVVMLNTVEDADESEWGLVTVTGQVKLPGVVSIPSVSGIKLTSAIQEAGGFAPSAKTSGIRISRIDSGGRKVQVLVNYNEIGQEGNADADLNLKAGDIVYVPERIF